MLSLFIVEDNTPQRVQIESAIKDYIAIEDLDIEIALSTSDPYECVNYLKGKPDIRGLYFLDVELEKEMNGIQLGQQIRELDPNGRIVMVTSAETMAYFTFVYKLEALDYIIKESADVVISKIRNCVKIAYERYQNASSVERRVVEVKIGNRVRNIPLEEVCFVETNKQQHYLTLRTLSGKIEFRASMREFAMSNPSLLRIHRAYLVNPENVVELDERKRILKMKNGDFCYISLRKMNEVKNKLLEKTKW